MYTALLCLLPFLATSFAAPAVKRNEIRGHYISAGRDGLCLTPDVAIGDALSITDGTPVVSRACADSLQWDVSTLGSSGSIFVHGNFKYALDAGSNPGNNGALKAWQSYPGLSQQTWFLTEDNRIAITGGNQCLDEGDNGIQTYQCTTGNTNQVFYLLDQPGQTTTTSAAPTPSTTTTTTSSAPGPTSTTSSVQFHTMNINQCLGVEGTIGVGSAVAIVNCATAPADSVLWNYSPTFTGAVQLASNPSLCLDAGDGPSNGSGLKVWTCYDGLYQQTWGVMDLNLQLVQSNNPFLCLDVVAGSGPDGQGSEESVQMWACSNNMDPQQFFSAYTPK